MTNPTAEELEAVLALPDPFHLFRLVSGSDHLHFGYFLAEDETIHEAQDNMMRLNLMFVRKQDRRVLDAGSGLGATARVLAERGLAVTAVCPDPALIAYSKRARIASPSGSVEWVCGRLEEYCPSAPFDLILFQESFQYFEHVEETLRGAYQGLRPGGRLVVGDQFLNEPRPRAEARFHHIEHFLRAARAVGFRLHTHCDISTGAARAIDWMLARLEREGPALVAQHGKRLPGLSRNLADMQRLGGLERQAFASGLLSYRILALDR
jgi:SAM-dependent methyltransferase